MSFHTIMNQLNNNLRPTRNHRINYGNLNSIQHASQQYGLGLISLWQFLQRMSHATTAYEQQLRNWALHIDNEPPIVVQPAAPVAANLVPVAPAEAIVLAPVLDQRLHVELPDNERQTVRDHPYHQQENERHRHRSPLVEERRRTQYNIVQDFYAELEYDVEPQQENEILEVCVICYNGIATTTIVPCQHHFCRVCIERWMRESRRCCPLCRTDIVMLQYSSQE